MILPVAAFAETSGTWVNVEGRWQSVPGAARPPGEARPAWKVLRVLGNLLGLAGFEYLSSEEIRDELARELDSSPRPRLRPRPSSPGRLASLDATREVGLYAVRRRGASLHTAAADPWKAAPAPRGGAT